MNSKSFRAGSCACLQLEALESESVVEKQKYRLGLKEYELEVGG